mgnify:CR=1 FL=1
MARSVRLQKKFHTRPLMETAEEAVVDAQRYTQDFNVVEASAYAIKAEVRRWVREGDH